ncbi:hypothetical protein ABTE31_20235, partial [Acinetobacter baumannii]
CKRDWRFNRRVQPQTQFAQKPEIRPKTCGDDKFIHNDMSAATRRAGPDAKAISRGRYVGRYKSGFDADFAG